MFSNCTGLIDIVFPEVNAEKLFNTTKMFFGCTNLKIINLKELIADGIGYMESMFKNCSNLENLNIERLDSRQIFSADHIFDGIHKKIKIIYNPRITGPILMNEIKKVTL